MAVVWTAGLAVAAIAAHFLPRILRKDLIFGDQCQHVFWTYRFRDPSLFPNDPIADFMSRPLFAPWGYMALYRALVPFFDAQRLATWIGVALAPLVVFFSWRLGVVVSGGRALGGAVAATSAIFAENLLHGVAGGLPRSFAVPILLLGVYGVFVRRLELLGAALLFSALFYPPDIVNLGLFAAIVLGVRALRERRLPEGSPVLLALGLVAAAVLASVYLSPLPEGIGPKTTLADARVMAEFNAGGRSQFFQKDPLRFFFRNPRAGLGMGLKTVAGFAAFAAVSAIAFGRAIAPEIWALGASALAAFSLAHATLFSLHLPNRYAVHALPAFAMCLFSAVIPRALDALAATRPGVRAAALFGRPRVFLALFALGFLGAGAWSATTIREKLRTPIPPGREEALAFLETLPKSALVAAHPEDADEVPLRARRSVLANMETSLPYYLGFYRLVSERIAASLAACFATSWADLDRLHERYGADVFFVNRARYEGEGWKYYAPFEEAARAAFDRGRREGFALLDPPPERVLFRAGDYAVVRLGPPRRSYFAGSIAGD